MKQLKQIHYLCLAAFTLLAACKKASTSPSRSFFMGTTPWPADFTEQELNNSYRFINENCDMVSHHFDEGIPYEEAFANNNSWPAKLQQDLATRLQKTGVGKKVLISSSALALNRTSKASYSSHSTTTSDAVKNKWQAMNWDNDSLATAYVNFVSYMATTLNATWINFGVESNAFNWLPLQFEQYKIFLDKVYRRLKSKFPNTPIMVSVMVSESQEMLQMAQSLMLNSDYVALSAYPYTSVSSSLASGNTNPANFPANYFERFINIAPDKPLAIAETGYIAEALQVASFSLNKQGNPQWQAAYLQKCYDLLNKFNGKFLVWFCHKDYDAGNNTIRSLGLYQDLFALWEDTGLYDENGTARPAANLWLQWYGYKIR